MLRDITIAFTRTRTARKDLRPRTDIQDLRFDQAVNKEQVQIRKDLRPRTDMQDLRFDQPANENQGI